MPKYRYDGQEACNVGTMKVNPEDTIEASFSPGKRFTLIEEPTGEPMPAEESGRSRKTTKATGGE